MCIDEYNEYKNIGVLCDTFTAIQPFAAGRNKHGFNDLVCSWKTSYCGGQMKVTNFIGFSFPHAIICSKKRYFHLNMILKRSLNSDTLGPVELMIWPEQGNQGDRREQDDQGKVSFIIFGMNKSSGFQKYSICWVFQALFLCLCHCLCYCLSLCICVLLWYLNSFHHKLSEYVWF